jgi:hypothetical protein
MQLTTLVDTFDGPTQSLLGSRQRVWVTDVASDKHHLTGHTRGYVQVRLLLVPATRRDGMACTCRRPYVCFRGRGVL